jgi:hypothetical protein
MALSGSGRAQLKPLASEAAILAAERQLPWTNVEKFMAERQLASRLDWRHPG